MTEPPLPPDEHETGDFSEFFHTEDLPVSEARPQSHRASRRTPPVETPDFIVRLLAPATAVIVVVIVVVLLIWINGGSSGNQQSPAAVGPGPAAAVTSHTPTLRASHTPAPVVTHSRTAHPTTTPRPQKTAGVTTHRHHTQPPSTASAPVAVLNNSTRTGLAAGAASQLTAKGWKVVSVGNLQRVTPETTVYFPPGDKRAAQHLAHDFSSIQRVLPNAAGGLHATSLTLVLTRTWVL